MVDSVNSFLQQEKGTDDDGAALPFSITSNDKVSGKNNATIASFVPDSVQVGDINVNVVGRRFPQSAVDTFDKDYTVTPTTERVPTLASARIWQYTISGSAVGQVWEMGDWTEEFQEGAAN